MKKNKTKKEKVELTAAQKICRKFAFAKLAIGFLVIYLLLTAVNFSFSGNAAVWSSISGGIVILHVIIDAWLDFAEERLKLKLAAEEAMIAK